MEKDTEASGKTEDSLIEANYPLFLGPHPQCGNFVAAVSLGDGYFTRGSGLFRQQAYRYFMLLDGLAALLIQILVI